MNNPEVKHVSFAGDDLIAVKAEDGQLYAGVNAICTGIGLSEGQMKAERARIQKDAVLAKGGRNFVLPTAGGQQEALCLQLDHVPLWLAKINITPAMQENNPEAAAKLTEYQLKAKDVLAAAFLGSASNLPMDYESALEQLLQEVRSRKAAEEGLAVSNSQILALSGTVAEQEAQIAEMTPKVSYLETILQCPDTIPVSVIAKDYGYSARAFNTLLYDLHIQYCKGGRWYLYADLDDYGYTQSYTELTEDEDGASHLKTATRWTQEGRFFLYCRLKRVHILPLCERPQQTTIPGFEGTIGVQT